MQVIPAPSTRSVPGSSPIPNTRLKIHIIPPTTAITIPKITNQRPILSRFSIFSHEYFYPSDLFAFDYNLSVSIHYLDNILERFLQPVYNHVILNGFVLTLLKGYATMEAGNLNKFGVTHLIVRLKS
jgi:hypothetical protein